MRMLWILGAGGHAKVVIATARAAGFEHISLADDDIARHGTTLLGAPISATIAEIRERADVLAVFAIGDNRTRQRLGQVRCELATLVHPSAIVDPTVILGPGTVVFAGSVIQPDARLGAHTIVNTAASIDHDCQIGEAVHLAPGVRLAGTITLGDGVFVVLRADAAARSHGKRALWDRLSGTLVRYRATAARP